MFIESPVSTGLLPGQSLRVAVDAGAMLLVEEGCVRLRAQPSWLSETMVHATFMLREGETHVAERGGWIDVEALSKARVRGVPQPAPVTRGAISVGRLRAIHSSVARLLLATTSAIGL